MKEKKSIAFWGFQNLENIISFVAMGVVSFFFLLRSPLHPWYKGDTGTDSSVFKTVALMMEKGYMPYKDSFDHKGPLLYILNWLGNRISEYRGVWVIELIFLAFTLFIMYKIARLMCNRNSAVIVTFVSMSLLFGYFEGGNLAEEYAMMFIAASVYIFVDFLKNGNISKKRLVLCGLTFACTLLLRPNMISVWVIMCIAVLMKSIVNKEYKNMGIFILWFAVGMAIILVPVLVWLGVNGALDQFWKDYIVFNREYISEEGGRALFPAKWNSFFTFFNTSVCITAFAALGYICTIREKYLNITYLIYMVATLTFMCMSGTTYGHYGMILVPAMVYPLALVFMEIERIDNEKISRIISIVLCVYSLSMIILPNWVELVKEIPATYEAKDENHISETVNTIADIINNKLDEDDAISVYGNQNIIYIISNHRHATRYSYQFPIGQIMPEIMNEYMAELHEELPKIIVVAAGYYDENIIGFLNNNQYNLLWSQNGESMDGALIYAQ